MHRAIQWCIASWATITYCLLKCDDGVIKSFEGHFVTLSAEGCGNLIQFILNLVCFVKSGLKVLPGDAYLRWGNRLEDGIKLLKAAGGFSTSNQLLEISIRNVGCIRSCQLSFFIVELL